MRSDTRQLVRQLFDFRCGYCGVRETDVGGELTIDHFQPRARGGDDDTLNLVYSCNRCNEFKSDYWQTEPDLYLFHPLVDNATEHFFEQVDGVLAGLTPRGRVTIEVLHLNRPELIAHRNEKRQHVLDAEQKRLLLQKLLELTKANQALEHRIERLFSSEDNS